MNAFFNNCTKILTGEPTKASATATAPNVAKHCRCDGEWFWQGYLLRSHGWTQVTYNWQTMSPGYPIADYDHTCAYEKDIDVKPYRADYASLTINDFWFRCTEIYGQPDNSPNEDGADYPQCVSYNPANGILHVRVFTSEDYGSIGYHGNFICLKPAA